MFAYKSYKLSDTLVLRGRIRAERPPNNRDTETEGVLPGTTNLRYHLTYNSLDVSSGESEDSTHQWTSLQPSGPSASPPPPRTT